MVPTMPESAAPSRRLYTPTTLNQEVQTILESDFASIRVRGEIQSFKRIARSGHCYFELVDAQAKVRCMLNARFARFIPDDIRDGAEVELLAHASLYAPWGQYQLQVRHLELAGEGVLRAQFEALKKQLQKEGLFDESRKQALPAYPLHIALITSTEGAAIKDFLVTMQRRWPVCRITVIPAQVQGKQAPPQLIKALGHAENLTPDAIVLTRGGGSLEDLAAFNDEALARALARCPFPTISAVGHESDVGITDFVADYRAATPTAAAQALGPDINTLRDRYHNLQQRLWRLAQQKLDRLAQGLDHQQQRLQNAHPNMQLQQQRQRLHDLLRRLQTPLPRAIRNSTARLGYIYPRLTAQHPQKRLRDIALRQPQLHARLQRAVQKKLQFSQQRLQSANGIVQSLSPRQTLLRGFAIVTDKEGHIIRDSQQLNTGQSIEVKLGTGGASAQVTDLHKKS